MTKQDWDKILIEYALRNPEKYLGKEVKNMIEKYNNYPRSGSLHAILSKHH